MSVVAAALPPPAAATGASSSAHGDGAAPGSHLLIGIVVDGGHRDASDSSRTSLLRLGRQQPGRRLIGSGGGERAPPAYALRESRGEES